MGIYLNPGAESFLEAINSDIYVDKTELIKFTNDVINKKDKYMCVSRPRRFGKTMAMNMLSAYYDCTTDADKLFRGLKFYKNTNFNVHANKYNVIRIEMIKMGASTLSVQQWIAKLHKILLYDFKKAYPHIEYIDESDLILCMMNVYEETGKKFVILVDEWDWIFRERQQDFLAHKEYLNFLRMLLKDQDYVALAYMTGILPIKKYGEHSALNMFTEFSMEQSKYLSEFVGFTNEEVRDLCKQYSMDYFECKAWYDGYVLKYSEFNPKVEGKWINRTVECYSPWSLTKAMINGRCMDYWTRTETYEALQIYIKLNIDGLKDKIIRLMSGDRYKLDTLSFTNDMVTFNETDDVLTLLVHLGYLGYDNQTRDVFIPNHEVKAQYATSIKNLDGWNTIADAIRQSDDLLTATIAGDNELVANLIENAHVETSHLQYNDENALSYTISLAYFTARRKYNIRREFPTGKGFADMVFLPLPHHPEMPPMIVELKWDKTAKTALDQIRNKDYTEGLKGYEGKILLVSINYDKNTRKHECLIERA